MAYNGKTNWVNNEIVEAADMNRIEAGISDNDNRITSHETDAEAHAELLDTKVNRSGDTMTGALDAPDLKVNGVSVYHPSNKPTPDDIGAAKQSQLSNPNLLINPFFQINQRGQSSYSGGRYTVDGWRLAATAATLSVLSDGIKIDATSGAGYYNQRLENPLTVGRTYTFSVKDDAGDIYVFTGVAKTGYIGQQATPWGDVRIEYLSATQGYYATISVDTGKTATIKAAKLELGEISTLANDAPPKISTDLAECQRYYLQGSSLVCAGTTTDSNTFVICSIPTPVTMRTIPTLTYSAYYIRIGGKLISNAEIAALSVQPNSVRVTFTLPEAEAVHTPVSVEFVDIKISAEL